MNTIHAKTLTSTDFSIAIVVSSFNQEITEQLLNGAVECLVELSVSTDRINIVRVPGAVEIPITAQRLAETERYEAIICLGAVIYGETEHFTYVCQQVSQGCQSVALSKNLPVIFGVLTTHNKEQAWDRVGGNKGHMGRESAQAAIAMISVLRQIDQLK